MTNGIKITNDDFRYGVVIAAAGMSSRLKMLEERMRINGMSAVERVIYNFMRADVYDIVIVTGYDADKFEEELRPFDVTLIRNTDYENNKMLDSAKMGLSYLKGKCDRVFFCPVDTPFFSEETLIAEKNGMNKYPFVKVVIPSFGRKDGHPLLISSSAIQAILDYQGDQGMRGAYESLPAWNVLRVDVPDEGTSVTDNTKESDYDRLVAAHNKYILHPEVSLQLVGSVPLFNKDTYKLLSMIGECGSVSKAAQQCGISYTKCWKLINTCEKKLGRQVVFRRQGGSEAGRAYLTENGRNLLAAYDELQKSIDEYAKQHFLEIMNKNGLLL